jgi:hypothetical protein
MTEAFEVSTEAFEEKVVAEFNKMRSFANYDEVVLWFEYDLFCQVNMLALLHWFNQQDRTGTKVSLICVGKEAGYDKLVALGEINPDRFPELFERRRIMGTQEFAFATDVYEAWCSSDPTDLETYTMLPSNEFPYLANAIRSHFRRFPSLQTGLTEIEQKIIDLINSGINNDRKIVGNLLRWQEFRGFGDSQYFQILKRLSPLLSARDEIVLKDEIKVLIDQGQSINTIDRKYYLGGALVNDWRWDQQKNELVPTRE